MRVTVAANSPVAFDVEIPENIIDIWADALESGEYEQERLQLRIKKALAKGGYAFCCLGVLADKLEPNGWSVAGPWHLRRYSLHQEIWQHIPVGFPLSYLIDLNDGFIDPDDGCYNEGKSFREIAAEIRAHRTDHLPT